MKWMEHNVSSYFLPITINMQGFIHGGCRAPHEWPKRHNIFYFYHFMHVLSLPHDFISGRNTDMINLLIAICQFQIVGG
jgi:hypothetical protein